jgi:hypothetical protein
MIQTSNCEHCNLERTRVSFDEAGIEEVECLEQKSEEGRER